MEILQLVDQLEQVLNRGWRLPFTSSLIVNEEECLRLIDQMRISVPSAIKESERMVAERDRILADAQERAEEIMVLANQEAEHRKSQHYITEEARREAEQIVSAGQDEALRMVQEAENYTLDVLQQLVTQLSGVLRQAENGIEAIEESRVEAGRSAPPVEEIEFTESTDPDTELE